MSRAGRLRAVALERVAERLGYRRDPNDRARWKRPGSVISISGTQFCDHVLCRGGGGAIDLAVHASGLPFRAALDLLERIAPEDAGTAPEPEHWRQVRRYLTRRRGLDPELIDRCRRKRLIGAELRGTRPGRPFKGMAPGSRKALGGFWIARRSPGPALLTESAIDALSAVSAAGSAGIAAFISTAGTATRLPEWITQLGPESILCGYDADEAGDAAARRLIENHPGIRRLRPEGGKDWNEILAAGTAAGAAPRGREAGR